MGDYIGIHTDGDEAFWLEKVEAGSRSEAYDLMERNDTSLMVFSQSAFDKLHTIVVPVGKMVKVG